MKGSILEKPLQPLLRRHAAKPGTSGLMVLCPAVCKVAHDEAEAAHVGGGA